MKREYQKIEIVIQLIVAKEIFCSGEEDNESSSSKEVWSPFY